MVSPMHPRSFAYHFIGYACLEELCAEIAERCERGDHPGDILIWLGCAVDAYERVIA